MNGLSPRDRELVALGAAMGSNCVPCVEYHIPESRKAGLADAEILAAIQHADKIRQVPARKTLQAPPSASPAPCRRATRPEGPAALRDMPDILAVNDEAACRRPRRSAPDAPGLDQWPMAQVTCVR